METLLQALITAGATIVTAWLAYNRKISKELFSLNSAHKDLSKEHVELRADLSSEHKNLSKEHVELREALGQKIQSSSDAIKDILLAEKVEKEKKHAELLGQDKDILHAVKTGSDASAALYEKYLELCKLNNALIAERDNLKQEVNMLQRTLNSKRRQYEDELEF